ncbi:MAG TPA: hypothetical protein DCS29_00990 [Candidatus Magasanikbacteria bacterium]|nr:MAG: hypothetical protein A2479_04615 [Candidatus Magasanikbacteria bacterium RIFOXYC2_FULL_39_8]HAT03339.1 hypothetical protein [Candidatus Magasanikbacteria bacterium]
MKEKYLMYVMKGLVIFSFFVPLIVLPKQFIFPFIVPKILIFRSLVLLLVGVYILLYISNRQKYKIRLTPTSSMVLLFFLSFVISTFVGVDWYRSLWDNHERMLGLFTITHYVIYYVILTSVFGEWKDWRFFMRMFLAAGSVVMFIAVWQKFVDPQALLNREATRVSATLGNAIYLSGYGLFLLFVGVLLGVKEKKNSFWQWYSFVGAALGFAGIFLGGTRGTFLGLFAGLGVVVFGYVLIFRDNTRLRHYLIGLFAVFILVIGISWIYRDANFVQNIPVVGRLVNLSFDAESSGTRLMAWGIAIDAWKEKPLFGWGPNNYYYAFNKYYRPEFLEHGWHETWFDNAHSAIFNTLSVQGIPGIVLYLGMFIAPLYVLWKKKKDDVHIIVLSCAFLIAHFIHNAFVFENPTSYLYFFFFLAFINGIIKTDRVGQQKKDSFGRTVPPFFAGVVTLLILLFIYTTNINPARANMKSFDAIQGLSYGKNPVELYHVAVETPSPHIDDIRNDFGRIGSQIVFQSIQKENFDSVKPLYELIYGELYKNIQLHPMDIRIHIQLSQLIQYAADKQRNVELIREAESLLEDAHKLSPQRQQVEYMLSQVKMRLGKNQEAIDLLQESITNDYKVDEGWWRLGYFYYSLGQAEIAQDLINEALQKGIVFTGQGESIVNQILNATSTNSP